MGHLVAAVVGHGFVGDEAFFLGEVEELGAGKAWAMETWMVSQSSCLGEVDGVADGLAGLAGQAEDEVAVDDEAELVAVALEVEGTLDGGALLDVLEDLLDRRTRSRR